MELDFLLCLYLRTKFLCFLLCAIIHDFWDVNLYLHLQYTFTDVHLCLIKMFGLEPSPCSIYIPPPSYVLCTVVFCSGKRHCFVIEGVFT